MMDSKIREKPYDYLLVAGKKMTVDVIDAQTVRFNLPAPKPGLLAMFATSYCLGFAPKHHLGQYHPDVNPNGLESRNVGVCLDGEIIRRDQLADIDPFDFILPSL